MEKTTIKIIFLIGFREIKNFQSQNLLQKEIFYYLAKIATDTEVQKLKQAFSIIDKDNSGEIEYEEIPKIFADLKIKASEDEMSLKKFLIL